MKSLAAVIIDALPFAFKKKSLMSLQWSPAFSLWRSPRMPMVMPMATKAPAVAICFAPNLPGRLATRLEEDRSRCPPKNNLCQWLRPLAGWGTIQLLRLTIDKTFQSGKSVIRDVSVFVCQVPDLFTLDTYSHLAAYNSRLKKRMNTMWCILVVTKAESIKWIRQWSTMHPGVRRNDFTFAVWLRHEKLKLTFVSWSWEPGPAVGVASQQSPEFHTHSLSPSEWWPPAML